VTSSATTQSWIFSQLCSNLLITGAHQTFENCLETIFNCSWGFTLLWVETFLGISDPFWSSHRRQRLIEKSAWACQWSCQWY